MSTNVSVKPKPPKASLGKIVAVHPASPSKKPNSPYYSVGFEIQPDNDPNGRTIRGWFVFHPQMFSPKFLSYIRTTKATDPDDVKRFRSMQFVYDANIGFRLVDGKLQHAHPAQGDDKYKPKPWYGKSAVPTLVGMFGENLQAVDDLTNEFGSRESVGEEIIPEIDAALQALVGTTVGYWETQDSEKKDTLNERGYPEIELLNRYKFECFFIPDKKNIKKLVEMGKKSEGRCLITFDGDVPYEQGGATPF